MKPIDKNIIRLGWVSFFTDMASSMTTILLPIFVVYVLHEGVDKFGIIIAVGTFVSYALRILFGYLSDRLGIIKPFILFGYLISAVSKPLMGFSHSYGSVALLSTLERLGKAVRSAPKDRLISIYSQSESQGRSFGLHKMLDISGELAGSVIVLLLFSVLSYEESSMRSIFFWMLLPGLISVLMMLFFVKDAPVGLKKRESFNKEDRHAFPLLGFYFLYMFFLLSDGYFILKAKESGFTLEEIPLFIILLTLTQALVSYYSGRLIDKKGSPKMLLLGFIFGVISLIALSLGFLGLTFVFLGLFTVISLNAVRTYISTETKSKATVYGIFYAGTALSASLGAVLIGYVWELWGAERALGLSLWGLSLTTLLFAAFLMKFRD